LETPQLLAMGDDIGRLYRRLQAAQEKILATRKDTMSRLVRAMTMKDGSTGIHMARVALQSALLAQMLGQDEAFCGQLSVAAVLHDIGKIAIPDQILLKPGKLEPEETAIMQLHTRYGAQLLEPDDFDPLMQMATEIALYHHEAYDGSGYPYGLDGENIPLAARILSVVDVYDSMTETRPYRPAHSAAEARQFITEQSGCKFDPMVVEAFLRLPEPQTTDGAE